MNFKLLPFFGLSQENKRRNNKEDVVDAVVKYQRAGGDCNADFEIYKYKNFCRFDGVLEDVLMVFVGNHYIVYKI